MVDVAGFEPLAAFTGGVGGKVGRAELGVFLGLALPFGRHGADAGALHASFGPTRMEGGSGMVVSVGRHKWRQK